MYSRTNHNITLLVEFFSSISLDKAYLIEFRKYKATQETKLIDKTSNNSEEYNAPTFIDELKFALQTYI